MALMAAIPASGAITAASAGDTITVAAGTYNEIGQIVINKDLSIVGAGATTTIIKPTSNTRVVLMMQELDPRGNPSVSQCGIWLLSGVTLDGAGYNIPGNPLLKCRYY